MLSSALCSSSVHMGHVGVTSRRKRGGRAQRRVGEKPLLHVDEQKCEAMRCFQCILNHTYQNLFISSMILSDKNLFSFTLPNRQGEKLSYFPSRVFLSHQSQQGSVMLVCLLIICTLHYE